MELAEIINRASEGSKKYFEYLHSNGLGCDWHYVNHIEFVSDGLMLIMFTKPFGLRPSDIIDFFPRNRKYKKKALSSLKIVAYNEDTKMITAQFYDFNEYELMYSSRDYGMDVVVDKKVFVSNIIKWFQQPHADFGLPEKEDLLQFNLIDGFILPGLVPTPMQLSAIEFIFKTPVNYIWGPPGTGKTTVVLAYAVLYHVLNKKKVLVLCTTNSAIANAMMAVYSILLQAGLDTDCILFEGIPSLEMMAKAPSISLAERLRKGTHELKLKLSYFITLRDAIKSYESIQSDFDTFKAFCYRSEMDMILEKLPKKLQKQPEVVAKLIVPILDIAQLVIQEVTPKITEPIGPHEEALIFESITPWTLSKKTPFYPDPAFNFRIKKTLSKATKSAVDNYLKNIEALLEEIGISSKAVKKYAKDIAQSCLGMRRLFQCRKPYADILAGLDVHNRFGKLNDIHNIVSVELGAFSVKIDKLPVNKDLKLPEIELQINEMNEELKSFDVSSRSEFYVLGTTIDKYISFRANKSMYSGVEHIFIDEASIVPAVKALACFRTNIPITFLGDHKQLPPVCEMDIQDISNLEENENVALWANSALEAPAMFDKGSTYNLLIRLSMFPKPDPHSLVTHRLNTTFRFSTAMSSILATQVYGKDFTSASNVTGTKLYSIQSKLGFGNKKRTNPGDIDSIRLLEQELLKKGYRDIAIITPYVNQQHLLQKEFHSLRADGRVLTVHKAQSREWDIVILSLVDSPRLGSANKPWFTDSLNPTSRGLYVMNTAVSRCKQMLIIVGDIQAWKGRVCLLGQIAASSIDLTPRLLSISQ